MEKNLIKTLMNVKWIVLCLSTSEFVRRTAKLKMTQELYRTMITHVLVLNTTNFLNINCNVSRTVSQTGGRTKPKIDVSLAIRLVQSVNMLLVTAQNVLVIDSFMKIHVLQNVLRASGKMTTMVLILVTHVIPLAKLAVDLVLNSAQVVVAIDS